jgi:cob(I)alamin adenosyltransferase
MKIYTKTGDRGETGVFGGPRLAKDDPRIEAYGTVDELNAVLGLVRCEKLPPDVDDLLARIQNELFDVGAELATPRPDAKGIPRTTEEHVAALEQAIDHYEAGLAPLKSFILPGGAKPAAWLHLARTVCRRAERGLVTLVRETALAAADGSPEASVAEPISPTLIVYLNRLSDLFFVLARSVNAEAKVGDVVWRKRG